MSDGTGKGFLLSATLHGSVALAMLLAYIIHPSSSDEAKVFELVAGEGDNYMAREAPALGTPGGVKVDVPKAPEPKPTPPAPAPEPVAPEPAVVPAPKPPTPTPTPPPEKPADAPVPNFKKQLVREVIRAESKAKMQIKKERDAEKKRLDAEKKKQEEDKKRMTKEDFDRAHPSKGTTQVVKNTPPKVKGVDSEGIAKGVVGGSTKNKTGGAGGKALTNDNDDVLAGYYRLFKEELRRKFEPPPGLAESLKATVEVRSNPDGSFTSARIVKPSGSKIFDDAVLEAIRRVRLPPRPDRKAESLEFDFTLRDMGTG